MSKIIGRKRFWILNFAVIAIFIISFIYIAAVGDSYNINTNCFFGSDIELDVNVAFSEEGVAEYEGWRFEDGQLVISLQSVKKGDTEVAITARTQEGNAPYFKTAVHVNALGTIFERSEMIFNFNGYRVVILQIMLVQVMVLGMMIYSYVDYWKKAKFGYPMIAAGGLALFCATLIAFLGYKMLNNVVTSFSVFIHLVSETGLQLLLVLAPFMVMLAFAMSVSNIWLLRNEGYRPVNALGIAFSILWIIGMGLSFGFAFTRLWNVADYRFSAALNKAIIYICCYFECMLLSTAVSAFAASKHTPPYDRDYIIILGCAIRADGTPTPLLRMRAESAMRFERAQYEHSGKHAFFVPSGGQGSDEIVSEAESMRRWLIGEGVPEEQIVPEDKSTSTEENMRFSKEVIEKREPNISEKKIAFATTNYHVFRGYIMANKCGYEAQGISAKTKWYFFPNAFLREFIGLLWDRKLMHMLQIAGFVALFLWLSNVLN